MAKFNVLSPLNHDGKPYAEGEIELDEKVAAPLLVLGVIETPAEDNGDGLQGAQGGEGGSEAPKEPEPEGGESTAAASSDAATKAAAPKSTKAKKG